MIIPLSLKNKATLMDSIAFGKLGIQNTLRTPIR